VHCGGGAHEGFAAAGYGDYFCGVAGSGIEGPVAGGEVGVGWRSGMCDGAGHVEGSEDAGFKEGVPALGGGFGENVTGYFVSAVVVAVAGSEGEGSLERVEEIEAFFLRDKYVIVGAEPLKEERDG
jgi:hypothetical protein